MKEKLKIAIKKSLSFLPDRVYINLYFRVNLGRKIDWKNLKTLNEKLQWMKFNYRLPLQTIVSDKILARDYVKENLGDKYLIPIYGVWENFNDIDFSILPKQFVLKCNHDSGGLVICKDKDKMNKADVKKKINKSLRSNFFYVGREYQYKNIKPKIYCEKFISENGRVPIDYKIYCFNGVPDVVLVCYDRFKKGTHRSKYQFYDQDWNYLPFNKDDKKQEPVFIERPNNLREMFKAAEILSKEFNFARIDFYNIKGRIYFSEITLTPNSGFDPDISYETDLRFGDLLKIPYWDDIDIK